MSLFSLSPANTTAQFVSSLLQRTAFVHPSINKCAFVVGFFFGFFLNGCSLILDATNQKRIHRGWFPRSSCCLLTPLPFSPSDGEAGEDLVRPRRRCRAAPGAAGLGQSAVGGHVRRQTTNPSARLSRIKAENLNLTDCCHPHRCQSWASKESNLLV